MEEHGISYHFRHTNGAHQAGHGRRKFGVSPCPRGSRPFIAVDAQHRRNTEHIALWRPERKFTTGKVALNDYDFKKPSANMKAEKTGDAKYEHGTLESYIYPGRYVEQSDGNDYAQVQLDRNRAEDSHFHAEGDCASLYPGALVNLVEHPDGNQNEQYLVLHASHSFGGESYRSGTGSGEPYKGAYEFMRSDRPFAPLAVTQKPFIRGPADRKSGRRRRDRLRQIRSHPRALPLGPQIRRVAARPCCPGLRRPEFLARSSRRGSGMRCWSNSWKAIPTSRSSSAPSTTPTTCRPSNCLGKKNISGWKTNSTTGGGGYNELVMDDSAGSELVRFHGQKDLDSTIENDEETAGQE